MIQLRSDLEEKYLQESLGIFARLTTGKLRDENGRFFNPIYASRSLEIDGQLETLGFCGIVRNIMKDYVSAMGFYIPRDAYGQLGEECLVGAGIRLENNRLNLRFFGNKPEAGYDVFLFRDSLSLVNFLGKKNHFFKSEFCESLRQLLEQNRLRQEIAD